MLAGVIGTRRGDEPPVSFEILAWAALLLVLVAYAARRGATIVPLVIVPFLLLLPLLNTKYEPLFNGRYFMPIVPLVAAGWALAVTAAHDRLQAARPVAGLLVIIAVIVTLALPVWHFVAYQRVALATGSNEAYASLAQRIREAHDPDEAVLVDEALGGERIASGRRGVSVVEYFLLLSPDPPNVRVGDPDEFVEYLDAHHDQALLVLLPRARRRLGAQYDLSPVGAPPRGQEQSIRERRTVSGRSPRGVAQRTALGTPSPPTVHPTGRGCPSRRLDRGTDRGPRATRARALHPGSPDVAGTASRTRRSRSSA